MEEFLRTKWTNTELYGWLESQTKNLYQQSYNLAYDLAKRAETAFQFERPQNASTEYIRMGYWTNARDGLLAGEQLFLGLKRLEAAYQGAFYPSLLSSVPQDPFTPLPPLSLIHI